MSNLEEIKNTMRDLINVQCSNGNWNYNEYMHGMANGMLLMMSIVDGSQPEFLEAPESWLKDQPAQEKVTVSDDWYWY